MIESLLSGPLAGLVDYPQFLVWSVIDGKKVPIDPISGYICNPHDPTKWLSAHVGASRIAAVGARGLAFVLSDNDPFCMLDVDHAYDGNKWSDLAYGLAGAFAGAYVEVSTSGTGLHYIFKAQPGEHGCKNVQNALELYHTQRFIALTGTHATGDVRKEFDVKWLVDKYFPPQIAVSAEGWTTEPVPEWNGPADDVELVQLASRTMSAANIFGGKGANFADLWNGNIEALTAAWPAVERPYDASHADAALAQRLAYWTGKNCERIERMMWQSALVRDKWTKHRTYLERTILRACAGQLEVLQQKPKAAKRELDTDDLRVTATFDPWCTIEQQGEIFRDVVYVMSQHRVMLANGKIVKPEMFKVLFGGRMYTWGTAGKSTKCPWEAYVNQPGVRYPHAEYSAFKPQLPPGHIFKRGGNTYVNTYVDVPVQRKVGDVSLFLNHLAKVLPDKRDQTILLSYMAACVQHKGVKFQWAPLLQGVEGNGKTLFTRCVAEAIGGTYVHWPKASKLTKEFNAWMRGKLFYAVEDIHVPDHKREVIEELKPMITGGDGLEIEGKGVDQVTEDICGNFMLNTNHRRNGVKTRNDRRICTLYTAQQKSEDLVRDGMSGMYFPRLYSWLRADGHHIVNEFLYTYPIPDEFNPAGACQRAPDTSTTAAAIASNQGVVEQEIDEAIAIGKPGFVGGWISAAALDKLLTELGMNRRISRSQRVDILATLGYEYHPALPDGRLGRSDRLFINKASTYYHLTDIDQISAAYRKENQSFPFDIGK